MTSFQVQRSGVIKETKPLPRGNFEEVMLSRTGGVKPESYSKPNGVPVENSRGINAFVAAVNTAYALHYPLVLTPDAIWMCIAQGLAQHINANAEKLRSMFVEHEGKKEIVVRRDDFVKGSATNPWPEVFDQFSEQIRKNIGEKTHDLLTPEYSTTGPVEKAAAQIVLMDSFKEYFRYTVMTMCGIPEITLEGTVDDWKKLRDRACGLAEYDLKWWIEALKPILDQFVAAASGRVDQKFWSTIYKQQGGSGGPYITGWIVTLFPYLGRSPNLSRNRYLTNWQAKGSFAGVTTSAFPPGVVSTPFKWLYYTTDFPMYFYAGFMTVTQDPDSLAIRPEIGWAVADEKEVEITKEKQKSPHWF